MSREIKFRAWNGEDIISPDYIDRDGTAWWKENSIPTCSKTLMQYTGLKDKNGIEIYEGDIVETEWIDETMGGVNIKEDSLVVFKNGCFWEIEDESMLCDTHEDIEVVGNIYQHPHLLNAQP